MKILKLRLFSYLKWSTWEQIEKLWLHSHVYAPLLVGGQKIVQLQLQLQLPPQVAIVHVRFEVANCNIFNQTSIHIQHLRATGDKSHKSKSHLSALENYAANKVQATKSENHKHTPKNHSGPGSNS